MVFVLRAEKRKFIEIAKNKSVDEDDEYSNDRFFMHHNKYSHEFSLELKQQSIKFKDFDF
jgi:hypothetical protein